MATSTFRSAVDRAMLRAKALSELDREYGHVSNDSQENERKGGGASNSISHAGVGGIVKFLQGITQDRSEKSSASIASMFVGKSIVLDNTKEISERNKAACKIKKQLKRSRVFSGKNVKQAKKVCSSETFSSSDIHTLHNVWANYMRKVLKSTSSDQLSAKVHQFELIGADVSIIESDVLKYKMLRGFIVDTSTNTYTIAVPPKTISSSSSNTNSAVSPSVVKYRTIKVNKYSVSLAILLPDSKITSRDSHPSSESSYLLLNWKNCKSKESTELMRSNC